MDSRLSGNYAFALTWRTLVAAALVTLLLQLLATTQFYATMLVLAMLALFTILDATRLYSRQGALMVAASPSAREDARRLHRMEALLDAVTVALFVLDVDDRIVFTNRAARLLAGEDIGRLTDIRALGGKAAARLAAMPVGGRQILTMADGRPMLVWSAAFAAPGAAPQRLVSLQAVSGELDAVQARAWSDMTRVLSHEMMNSLTPIVSLSESLPGLTGEDRDAAMQTIARRSRHLMNFVERYRQIADLPPPQLLPLSLTAFAADIDALMRAHLKGVAWQCSTEEGSVAADSDLLSQAMINLLRNAAEAAEASASPSVSLAIHHTDAEVHFCVRDNGPGIAAEHLPEIFVPFFTTKQGGSGIGLTLARQIALAHGGRIIVTTTDRGAIFTLALPVRIGP